MQYNAKYEAGTTITLIEPTKEGYTFNEWTVSGTGASIEDNILIMGTENTTVTAIWKEVINLEEIYISSPDWLNNYPRNMTKEENY